MYQSFLKARQQSEGRLIETWDNLVTSFAPESMISPQHPSRAVWHFTWLNIVHWDYTSYVLHTLGDRSINLETALLSGLVTVFTKLVVLIGHNAWEVLTRAHVMNHHMVEEVVNESSPIVVRRRAKKQIDIL